MVDTTAAGDSFTAALAYGLSEGRGLRDALELAIYVSGLVVTRRGAQTSIPGRERVKEFMALNK
nr:PfkB family carbohydrate kinase [Acutalibacter muris]